MKVIILIKLLENIPDDEYDITLTCTYVAIKLYVMYIFFSVLPIRLFKENGSLTISLDYINS